MINLIPMIFLLSLLTFFSFSAWSAADVCEILNLKDCAGVSRQSRRSSQHSLPSPSTAASNNPASVSFDRGVGLEMIAQANNPVVFSIASGTGKMGGAFLSSSQENNFFGNRVFEIDAAYLDRRLDDHHYKNNKLNLALGGKLIDQKNFGLDLGVLLKRHNRIKKVNTGGGLSGRLGPINFGGAVYQDDVYIDFKNYIDPNTGVPYQILYGQDFYKEKFTVQTYTVGTKIRNFAFDVGHISTKYKFTDSESKVYLYSAAFNYKNFLINYAIRNEKSATPEFKKNLLVDQTMKVDNFVSVQYSFGKHVIFGVNYNYFLLDETSLTLTIFI